MFRAAFTLLIVTVAGAQTPPPDSQALQSLVSEIRQLRLDMQATNIATQRVQIVLYRMQMETALVTRASSRLDDVRSSLGNIQSEKKNAADRISLVEESLKRTDNPAERKVGEDNLAQMKAAVERMTADEERLQARASDAEALLKAEETKLSAMQEQLDRLDQLLDSYARKQQ